MLSFSLVNNWSDFPEFCIPIVWERYSGNNVDMIFEFVGSGLDLKVRLNDFPEEPLYSLICNEREIIHFNDWPEFWGTRPGDEKEEL